MFKKLFDFGMKMYKKYEEIINYLIVGFATTGVYVVACFIFERFVWDASVPIENALINTCGWLVGVIFAYVNNRKFVFKSENANVKAELTKFFIGRLATWALDVFIMWLMVNKWNVHYWIAKIFVSIVLVMVANYLISKLIVFVDPKKKELEKNK